MGLIGDNNDIRTQFTPEELISALEFSNIIVITAGRGVSIVLKDAVTTGLIDVKYKDFKSSLDE